MDQDLAFMDGQLGAMTADFLIAGNYKRSRVAG